MLSISMFAGLPLPGFPDFGRGCGCRGGHNGVVVVAVVVELGQANTK
jgi:hypothetical protein